MARVDRRAEFGWRRYLLAVTCIALGTGCELGSQPAGTAVRRAWESPPATAESDAPAQRLADESDTGPPNRDTGRSAGATAVATVNGVHIPRDQFQRLLIDMYGIDLLDLQIRVSLAKQAAAAKGLAVSDADIRAEYERALVALALPGGHATPEQVDAAEAERLLEQVLARNHVGRRQFMLKVEMDAYLRKLAESQVVVTDEMLPAEYERCYGERVQVRHIQLDSLADVQQVRERLAAGESFGDVARACSRNTVTGMNGGLLPPFSRHDDAPALLKEAAFALEVGQVSATIAENGVFQVLRLEQRFPASQVRLEYVKDELRRRLRDRLVAERMVDLAAGLFDRAVIRISDPSLAEQFRVRYPGLAGR